MSSVDDPEKHFLGNLLEDDTGTSSAIGSSTASSSGTPSSTLSQLTNVGPVMRPVADPSASSAWPEPPPPYSPPMEPSWSLSNVNTTLQSSSSSSVADTPWYTLPEHREQSNLDFLGSLSALNDGYHPDNSNPANPFHQLSPRISHFHKHEHNIKIEHHYPAPPPGLEAFGPRHFPPHNPPPPPATLRHNPAPMYDSLSPLWNYGGGLENNTGSSSMLFSDWKNKNKNQTSPQTTTVSDSSLSLRSLGTEDEVHLPLSPAEVIEVAKEKKQVSKSYADHLSKSNTSTPKKGTPIGAEKKQKQELAKKTSQTLAENVASKVLVKGQPHSAPVVSKMPFSYRDVAARVEHSSNSIHSISHQEDSVANNEKKDATSSTRKSEARDWQTKRNETPNTKEFDNSKKRDGSRKSRADNEFQKINNRKNKKENNAKVATAPIVLESVHPVDSSSRYDVLKNLESLPAQRNGKKNTNGRPPLIQEVFSRSSSPAEELDDTEEEDTNRTRSASNHAHLNGNGQMKKEQKKRVVQANQRRRKGRKTETTWIDNAIANALDFLTLLWGCIVHMFQWTFELIVDVCVKIYDVFLCSFECLCTGAWKGIRKVFLTIVCCFCALVCYFKKGAIVVSSFTLLKLLGYQDEPDEVMEIDWGCKKELPIPTNANEYAERLSRETIRDAYSVFGLKSDCSDDDIKRNFKRIAALVSPDKCVIEAADDVFFLVNMAFEAIGNHEARSQYTVQNAKANEKHEKVVRAWEEMSIHFEDSRNRLFCDCNVNHYRVATNVVPSQARYCKRCAIYHPAKQNDIWVEKRNLGLTSVYFTCTDNVVYDITEWATCESQRAMLKNMRAHTHHVQYRLLSPMSSEYDAHSSYFNSSMNYPSSSTDPRFLTELQEEYSSILRQRNLAQISFKTCEPREEDRSRRAANRRQKRWR